MIAASFLYGRSVHRHEQQEAVVASVDVRTPTDLYLATRRSVDYRLPDGAIVPVSIDRDEWAPSWVSYTIDGRVVTATRIGAGTP